jgi:hypothetical protein
MKDHAKKPKNEARAESEARLDEALDETFPASDPPSTTPTSAGGPDRSGAKTAGKSDRPSGGRSQSRRR